MSTSNKNIIDACKNAIKGVIYAVRTQKNVRIQLIIAVVVIIAGVLLKINKMEAISLIFAISLVIITEIINTAIETVVDLYVDLYHPKAKIAKDVGAGAVIVAAINAVVIRMFNIF